MKYRLIVIQRRDGLLWMGDGYGALRWTDWLGHAKQFYVPGDAVEWQEILSGKGHDCRVVDLELEMPGWNA